MQRAKGSRDGALGPIKPFFFNGLGVIISYGHFEQQTLQHRINEARQKLHLVRKFVLNRMVASSRARLRVWISTVQSTVLTGADTGLTPEAARSLRGWHAHKMRSVPNQPAQVSSPASGISLRFTL